MNTRDFTKRGFNSNGGSDALFESGMTCLGAIVVAALVLVLGGAITGIAVMWLWNGIVTSIWELRQITWLDGWGLSILCGILFKNPVSTTNTRKG